MTTVTAPTREATLEPSVTTGVLARPPRRGLWWVTPIGSLAMVVPLTLIIAYRTSDLDYRLFYKAPKVLGSAQVEVFLLATAALMLGALLPMAWRTGRQLRNWPVLPATQLRVLRKGEQIAFALTAFGYTMLGLIGISRGATPSLIINAVTSQDNYTGRLKTVFAPVAGVSSFTQIGIAYVVIAGLLLCHERSPKVMRRLAIVLFLGLARSYLLTERLAVLELIVPLIAIGATRLRQRPRRGQWLPFAPVVALPVLLVVFGAFEYSRSWVFYRTRTTLSFPEFVVNRLAGYYATSYNNGALQMAHNQDSARLPYNSIEVFWTAPGMSQLDVYYRLTGQHGPDFLNRVLSQFGNPEFNNPGGLAVPLIDFGIIGGLLFFAVAGVLIGFAYRSWRNGQPAGLLIYPVLFTGLLELPRYLYWTQGRVFPPMVFLGLLAVFMARSNRRPAILEHAPSRPLEVT